MGNKLCTATDGDEVPDMVNCNASPTEAGSEALQLAGVSAELAPGPEPEHAPNRFLQKADAGADAEWVQVPRSPESENPEPEPPSIITNRTE